MFIKPKCKTTSKILIQTEKLMKKVYVDIYGTVCADGETDNMNYSTEGYLRKKNGKYYIQYKEGELSDSIRCSTTIKVNPDGIVTMLRSGEANTQMIFEKDRCHISCYETNFGNLTVSVTADKVNIDLNDDGGTVDVGYNLSINNTPKSRNNVLIKVRP